MGKRKKLINGNGFVFGVSGSGKSFFCKMEMGSVFLSGNDEIIVIDPQNEYFDIAKTYGGTVVNMSAYTDNYVNPLAIDVWNLDQNDTKGLGKGKRRVRGTSEAGEYGQLQDGRGNRRIRGTASFRN